MNYKVIWDKNLQSSIPHKCPVCGHDMPFVEAFEAWVCSNSACGFYKTKKENKKEDIQGNEDSDKVLSDFFLFAIEPDDPPLNILRWYVNVFEDEDEGTERRIVADAIKAAVNLYVPRKR